MKLIELVSREGGAPVVPLMGYPGVAAAGMPVEVALTKARRHLECLAFLEQRYQPQCLFHIMDLTVEAEALGLPVRFDGGGPPSVCGHPVKTPDALAGLRLPEPSSSGRMPIFLEVVRGMVRDFGGLAGAYCVGPFTLAAELCGAEDLAMRTITDPWFTASIVDFAADACAAYAGALARAGAGVVAFLEPTAVILSPATFDSLCVEPLARVAAAAREGGACPVLHICGNTTHLLALMAAVGTDGLSLDAPVDLGLALEAVPDDMLIIGNVDPVAVMVEGSPDDVKEAAGSLVERFGGRPNYVLSSGCDLPLETPLANLDALVGQASA